MKLLPNVHLYRTSKGRRKKKQGKPKKSRIQRYADKLNADLPKSEQWFQAMFNLTDLYHNRVIYNAPKGGYIVDVLDTKYRYYIEIDGSYHDSIEQQYRDKVKDLYLQSRCYLKCFRIKAYDIQSYNETILAIEQYIKLYCSNRTKT